jgi:nucleoside-diphosphate-sugar epimerase
MKIVITGVNGFVGKKLYRVLSEKHNVIGLYNSGNPVFENCYKADLTNEEEIDLVFGKSETNDVDVIVHLASKMANAKNTNDLDVLYSNTIMAKNIAFMAKKLNVNQVVNLSSSSVYPNIDGVYNEESIPNPSLNSDCIYGLSKLNGEIILNYFLAETDIKVTHLRASMIYGEGMDDTRLIPVIEKEIFENNSVTLFGNGERILNLVKVEKLVEYISFFIEKPLNDVLNIGDECISSLDLARQIISKKGNSETKIILKEQGSKSQFILDIRKLNKIISSN